MPPALTEPFGGGESGDNAAPGKPGAGDSGSGATNGKQPDVNSATSGNNAVAKQPANKQPA